MICVCACVLYMCTVNFLVQYRCTDRFYYLNVFSFIPVAISHTPIVQSSLPDTTTVPNSGTVIYDMQLTYKVMYIIRKLKYTKIFS